MNGINSGHWISPQHKTQLEIPVTPLLLDLDAYGYELGLMGLKIGYE